MAPATNRIAFVRQDDAGHSRLCTMHPTGNGVAPLNIGDDLSDAWGPAWSPDGQQLCFVAHLNTYSYLYLIRPDGSGLQQLTTGTTDDDFPAWSPDGTRIAFSRGDSDGGDALFVLHPASGEVQRLTPHSWLDTTPTWSPDGQWLAFHRVFGQPSGLYVVSTTGGNARFLTPGHFPDLSPWGSRLAFVHADSLWVMSVTDDGSSAGNARPVTRALGFRDASSYLKSAVGEMVAAVKKGLVTADCGADLMGRLCCVSRDLAWEALTRAQDSGGKAGELKAGWRLLAAGEDLLAACKYSDAATKFKEALLKANASVKGGVDWS